MTTSLPVASAYRINLRRNVGFVLSMLALIGISVLHITLGARTVSITEVMSTFFSFNDSNLNHIIIMELRVPRLVAAIVAGSGLALAGAGLQALTRNPLADPGLLSILSGASFFVLAFVSVLQWFAVAFIPLVAAVGASVSGVCVWGIAKKLPGGASPLALILSGAIVSAMLTAAITLVQLFNDQSFNELRVWLVGSLAGNAWPAFYWVVPLWCLALVGILSQSRVFTLLLLGEQTAQAMGAHLPRRKALIVVCLILLSAAAVAVAGPLGFVGLVIPHVVKMLIGADYRWVLPFSAVLGATYLIGVDCLARTMIAPRELSTGLLTVLIGSPLFIYLVRQNFGRGLR